MPKVISRSIVVTDQNRDEDEEKSRLNVYFCICGSMTLISVTPLESLPKRKVDSARYIDSKIQYKMKNMKDGPTVFLKRDSGKEQQCRKLCKRCGLLIAYVCEPETDKMYLVDGALLREDERPDAASLGRSDETALDAVPSAGGAAAAAAGGAGVGAMDADGEVSLTEDGSVPTGATGTVTTSARDEDLEIEKRELSANFDVNAQVIEKYIGRNKQGRQRDEMEQTLAAKKRTKRGTLLN